MKYSSKYNFLVYWTYLPGMIYYFSDRMNYNNIYFPQGYVEYNLILDLEDYSDSFMNLRLYTLGSIKMLRKEYF